MKPSDRVLKKTDWQQRLPVLHESAATMEQPLTDSGEAAAVPASGAGRRGGVLRGREARLLSRSYEVSIPEYVPDFPLPEEPDDPDEEDGAGISRQQLHEARAAWEAEWNARLEEERALARAAAHAEGYAEAQAALRDDVAAHKAAMLADVERLRTAWQEFIRKAEPMLATLAFDVARQLLEAPLPQDLLTPSRETITRAVEAFGERDPVVISLHPDDLARLQDRGFLDDLEAVHSGLRWDPNPDLEPGDWVAQSPEAAVRWLKQELLDQLRRRFGLLAVTRSEQTPSE